MNKLFLLKEKVDFSIEDAIQMKQNATEFQKSILYLQKRIVCVFPLCSSSEQKKNFFCSLSEYYHQKAAFTSEKLLSSIETLLYTLQMKVKVEIYLAM